MTPQRQRRTVLDILLWAVVGCGICGVVTGTLIVFGPYEVARDTVVGILTPLLVLTSWSKDIYIDSDLRLERLTVASTTFLRGVEFSVRSFGSVLVATGTLITTIASILIRRAKEARHAD